MHKDEDLTRCEICEKKAISPVRDLSIIYISDEEFRLCGKCRKDFIYYSRMLFNGLRKLTGSGPKIFKETSLQPQSKESTKQTTVKVVGTTEHKEYRGMIDHVARVELPAVRNADLRRPLHSNTKGKTS